MSDDARTSANRPASNWFFVGMSAALLVIVVVGFSRSFFLQSFFEFPDLPMHLHVHGAVLTAWFLLALLQPYLVRTNRVSLHRSVGVIGASLAVAVVIVGLWTLVRRDAPTIDEEPNAAAGNLASLIMFASCIVLGLASRKRPDVHRRLMLLASIPIVAPALDRVGRIPAVQTALEPLLAWFPAPVEVAFGFVGFLTLVLTVVAFDLLSSRRIQAGTWQGLAGIFFVAPVLTAVLTASGAWAGFVRMLT